MTANQMKTAIYCRLALKDDERMDFQKERLLQYALEQGYSDISLYVDNGANGNNFDRPGFSQLNKDIEDSKIHVVLVQSIDRIGRNMVETMQWINQMAKKGVTFKTHLDNHDRELFNMMMEFCKKRFKQPKAAPLPSKKGGV